jgi:hypothetical protein
MRSLLLCACAVATLTGCNWGTRPRNFPPAQGPAGALVSVRVTGDIPGTRRVGELYAADAEGVIVLLTRLTRMPWRGVHSIDVHRLDHQYDVAPGATPDAAHIARLAAVSRFPQGLGGELLRRVLERLAQDSLDIAAALSLDSIADVAARSSARYRDRRIAMAAGYRRIGADFPGMGEHWVNPAALLRDVVDPARPSFLTYVTIDSAPRLVGIGFITTTSDSSALPSVPGWAEHWHEHSGLLSEESGARVGRDDTSTSRGSRVWVLHVWTTLENPDGRFAADNWSLPFARAGLVPPPTADPDAARAFGLAGPERGDAFLRALLTDAGLRTAATAARADSVIAAARVRSAAVADRMARGSVVNDSSLMALRDNWRDMAASLEELLGPRVATLLAPAHRGRGHDHSRAAR